MTNSGIHFALRGLPPPSPPPPSPPPPPPFYLRARLAHGADYHTGSTLLAALRREAQSSAIGKAA